MPSTQGAGHPKPRGRVPADCYWDAHHEPNGVWRRCCDDEIHDQAAAKRARSAAHQHRRTTQAARQRHNEQQARTHAAGVRARRFRRHNAARCNDVLFDPAAVRLDDLKYENLGKLGDEKCGHCQALLYRDEAVPSKWAGWKTDDRAVAQAAARHTKPPGRGSSHVPNLLDVRVRD